MLWLQWTCNYYAIITVNTIEQLPRVAVKTSIQLFCFVHLHCEILYAVCKFREIWPTGSRWNRALVTGQKTHKISVRAPTLSSARIAPKNLSGPICSECPKFHPNPFTSGGVTAEGVNVVETRHKVFPILSEATGSSQSYNSGLNAEPWCMPTFTSKPLLLP